MNNIVSNLVSLFLSYLSVRYIEDPVLFDRPGLGKVKFDIRYILLLQSVKPLKVFAYSKFWLRFANIPFDLTELDTYEKHYTVMNYNDVSDFKQVSGAKPNLSVHLCSKFIRLSSSFLFQDAV